MVARPCPASAWRGETNSRKTRLKSVGELIRESKSAFGGEVDVDLIIMLVMSYNHICNTWAGILNSLYETSIARMMYLHHFPTQGVGATRTGHKMRSPQLLHVVLPAMDISSKLRRKGDNSFVFLARLALLCNKKFFPSRQVSRTARRKPQSS